MRFLLALSLCLLAQAGIAQVDPGDAAARAAARLDAAAARLARVDGARDRVHALTETIRAFEDGLAALRESLRRATLREAAIRERFDAEAAQLGQFLGVLQTLESHPEARLLLHPSGALGTVRSGLLIADVAPAIAAEADRLRDALTELQTMRALQTSAEATLAEGLAGLQQARVALSQAMSDRRDLPRRVTEDPEQIARLIDAAETLSAFAASLADLPSDAAGVPLPDFAAAAGNLDLPVSGRLRYGFNQVDAAGIRRPGWIVETEPGALVTAPWPATLRYAGPLLDYGNVMILEPSADYLMVLAGLAQVYGAPGDIVPAGRPVGLMPETDDDDAPGAGERKLKTLYIEIRQGGAPLDPKEWFRQDEDLNP